LKFRIYCTLISIENDKNVLTTVKMCFHFYFATKEYICTCKNKWSNWKWQSFA